MKHSTLHALYSSMQCKPISTFYMQYPDHDFYHLLTRMQLNQLVLQP